MIVMTLGKTLGDLVPHSPALLGGSDTICNDQGKNDSHICAITQNDLSIWSFLRISCNA
jgi:hypothetical protein